MKLVKDFTIALTENLQVTNDNNILKLYECKARVCSRPKVEVICTALKHYLGKGTIMKRCSNNCLYVF